MDGCFVYSIKITSRMGTHSIRAVQASKIMNCPGLAISQPRSVRGTAATTYRAVSKPSSCECSMAGKSSRKLNWNLVNCHLRRHVIIQRRSSAGAIDGPAARRMKCGGFAERREEVNPSVGGTGSPEQEQTGLLTDPSIGIST